MWIIKDEGNCRILVYGTLKSFFFKGMGGGNVVKLDLCILY